MVAGATILPLLFWWHCDILIAMMIIPNRMSAVSELECVLSRSGVLDESSVNYLANNGTPWIYNNRRVVYSDIMIFGDVCCSYYLSNRWWLQKIGGACTCNVLMLFFNDTSGGYLCTNCGFRTMIGSLVTLRQGNHGSFGGLGDIGGGCYWPQHHDCLFLFCVLRGWLWLLGLHNIWDACIIPT